MNDHVKDEAGMLIDESPIFSVSSSVLTIACLIFMLVPTNPPHFAGIDAEGRDIFLRLFADLHVESGWYFLRDDDILKDTRCFLSGGRR